MTKAQYEEYKKSVAEFFEREGLANLSTVSDENGNTEPHFSWRSCQCCGTSLGGDRYHCNGYNPEKDQIQEYDRICEDCVYFAEYGRLDDTTMMKMGE